MTNVVKTGGKSIYVFSCYGITFDGAGWLYFDNEFARNTVMSDVVNSSSYLTDNLDNSFLVLGGGSTNDINDNVGTEKKRFSIASKAIKSKAMPTFL